MGGGVEFLYSGIFFQMGDVSRPYAGTGEDRYPVSCSLFQLPEILQAFVYVRCMACGEEPVAAKGYDIFQCLERVAAFIEGPVESDLQPFRLFHEESHDVGIDIPLLIQGTDDYGIDTQSLAHRDSVRDALDFRF